MWCGEQHHDRISLYPVPQITRANASTGSLRRQGLRPQPARPPRPRRDTAGSRAAPRAATANHRRSHPPSGHPVSVPTRRGKVTFPESGVGARARCASGSTLAMRAVTRPGLRLGFRQRPRAGWRVEFGFQSGGCAHLDRRQPEARQPALRRTQNTCDHLGRNLERLCDFQSRMGSLAAQAEVQAASRAATRGATANGRRGHPPSGHPVSVAAWCGKVTLAEPGVGLPARRERIKTSDARGDQTRTSSLIPATTARRVGGGVRLPVGRLRAFG